MMDPTNRALAELTDAIMAVSARVEDVSRRQASMVMTGKVAAIDGNSVRLELGAKDERTGKPFLSPWVQMQAEAGATASHFPVKVGDPMRLLSPNGELGPASLAIRDSHTKDAPNPASENTDLVLSYGGCKITMQEGRLLIEAAGATIELAGGDITFKAGAIANQSDSLTHNDKDVGDTHKHTEVVRGGDLTGVPA